MTAKRPSETENGSGARWPWWTIAGLLILAAGLGILVRDVEAWNTAWYVPAWYGYLLLLDGWLYRLAGRSFVSHRRRELGAMLFWSLPFWFLFEAYNLVLQNWYYVFVPRSPAVEAVLSALAFATVLPACLFHAEALEALGVRDLRWRPWRVGRGLRLTWLGLGVASVAAPLVWPRHAFPLVWGAVLWLPDLANERAGAPSLLGDLGQGRSGRVTRLLLGGLWAGVVWELCNYWARCKWIYTVPGFEDWKLFEMPLAGFLGFPVFALAAFASFTSIRRLRGRRLAVAAVAAVVFSAVVHDTVWRQPHHPRRPLLAELAGVDARAALALRDAGLPTPERFYAAAEAEGTASLARRLGLDPAALEQARRHAALALHKGMGTENAALLLAAGVGDVPALAAADAEALVARLAEAAARQGVAPPRPPAVKVWVRAARWSGGVPRR